MFGVPHIQDCWLRSSSHHLCSQQKMQSGKSNKSSERVRVLWLNGITYCGEGGYLLVDVVFSKSLLEEIAVFINAKVNLLQSNNVVEDSFDLMYAFS